MLWPYLDDMAEMLDDILPLVICSFVHYFPFLLLLSFVTVCTSPMLGPHVNVFVPCKFTAIDVLTQAPV